MADIKNIPAGTVTLTFPTEGLLKNLGLPHDFEISNWGYYPYPTEDELANSILYISKNDEGELVDYDDKVIPEDAVEELKQATMDATQMGTEGAYVKRVYGALEDALDTFSGYRYEYPFMPDREDALGVEHATGTAKGIESVEVSYDTTTIVANLDLVHAINDCIAGVGMFEAQQDLEGEEFDEFIKSRFHHLKNYWEIYGERKPKVDTDNVEDFDDAFFRERAGEIEKEFDLRLVQKRGK